jgi:enamine deaminase RidA (YjgF/YER057c/UK114 family)
MERRTINPWTWQDQFGFVQAVEVSGPQRILFCTGQTATDPTGTPVYPGDMAGQTQMAMNNLETVLGQAGFKIADVVRLKIFTTDMETFLAVFPTLKARLDQAECRCAQTLVGVVRLAAPTLLVEIEATAVK